MGRESIVNVSGLNHYFGQGALRRQVLFEIDLQIYPKEIVIMKGPSGAGKTTLLTLLGGLRSVQEGSLQLMGEELRGTSERKLVALRRQIGFIFQSHNLLPFLTANQNVQIPFEFDLQVSRQEARRRAEALLQAVKLGAYLDYFPQQLLGGQKQRIAIARALVTDPKLILADEPTASLDSKTGREVVELMYQLATEQGAAVLMVTHDTRILDFANRIISVEDGRLFERS